MKASAQQIAKRYVTALISVAEETKSTDAVEKDMIALQVAHAESDEFRALLANPLLGREQQAKIIGAVLDKIKAHKTTQQFMAALVGQKRLNILPHITQQFLRDVAKKRGEMAAEIVSATPLSAKEIELISGKLGDAYGKKIVASTREDKELLGGMVINIGSVQLDASLSGKLRRLGHQLKAA